LVSLLIEEGYELVPPFIKGGLGGIFDRKAPRGTKERRAAEEQYDEVQ